MSVPPPLPPPLPGDPFVAIPPQPPPVPFQMGAVSDDESSRPKPTACVQCGSIHFSARTKLPVCEPCRVDLVKLPFPGWVRLAAVLVAGMVLVSLAMSKERFQEARHLTRAKKMLGEQRWEEAFQDYHSVIARHQDTSTLLDYAEAATCSGHVPEAVEAMQKLGGRQATRIEQNRAQSIASDLKMVIAQKYGSAASTQQPLGADVGQIQLQPGSPLKISTLQPVTAPGQLQPNGQLNIFDLQSTPPGSVPLNNVPIRLQTR